MTLNYNTSKQAQHFQYKEDPNTQISTSITLNQPKL